MFDKDYQFEFCNWRERLPEGFDAEALLAEPIEQSFQYPAEGTSEPVTADSLALASGLFELDGDYIVAKDNAACRSFFIERFSLKKILPLWGDLVSISREFHGIRHFGVVNDVFEKLYNDVACYLHNEHRKDFVTLAADYLELDRPEAVEEFCDLWNSMSSVLPLMTLSEEPLIRFLELLLKYSEGPTSSIGWDIYGVMAKLAELQPQLGKSLFDKASSIPEHPLEPLMVDLLVGLSRNQFVSNYETAVKWMGSDDPSLIAKGCYAVSSFDFSVESRNQSLESAVQLLIDLESLESEEVLVSIAAAYGRLVKVAPRCIEGIERLAALKRPAVKQRVTHTLNSLRCEERNELWFRRSVNLLAEPCTEDVLPFRSLDFIISDIAKQDVDAAMDFIERWLVNHSYGGKDERVSFTKSFHVTLSTIQKNRDEAFPHLATKWFLAKDLRLHRAASDLIHELSVRRINGTPLCMELDQQLLSDQSYEDICFVLRKILGFVHFSHASSSSLVFSLQQVRHQHDKLEELVIRAFRDVLGYNYPGNAYRFLNAKIESGTDGEEQLAQSCINRLDEYYDQLKALPAILEFRPPTLRVRQYDTAMQRIMNEEKEKAQEQSVLLTLFSSVTLKYGRKAAFQIDGKTQVSKMHTIEHSSELSRGDMIDPTRMHQARLEWRYAGSTSCD